MSKKLYCVHVYSEPYEYDNIEAPSSEAARALVINHEYGGDDIGISHIEVMRQCDHCGLDNDVMSKTCSECSCLL